MNIKITKETFHKTNIEDYIFEIDYKERFIRASYSPSQNQYVAYIFNSKKYPTPILVGETINGEIGTSLSFGGNNIFEAVDKAIKNIDNNSNPPKLRVA